MRMEPSNESSSDSMSLLGESWLLLLSLVMAVVLGGGVAAIGWRLGWAALIAIPILFFLLAVMIRPEFGLSAFVFIVFLQLTYVISNYYRSIPSPAILLLALLMFLVIWRMVIYGDRPSGWKRASVIFIIVAFWLLSVLIAEDSALALAKFRNFTENVLLAFVVIFFVQKSSSLRGVIWAMLAAGIFMATISTFQNLTSTYDNNYWGFGGWDSSSTGGTSNHRLTGPYGNPNAYAQVLVVLVPLALDRFWHERDLRLRLLAGWALVVCVLTVFFTYSRNGFVTLMFALGFLFIMRRPKVLPVVASFILAFILLQFLPVSYTERISTLFQFSPSNSLQQVSDESFRGRLSENIAAWRMFQDHPIFGVGLDNFQVYYQSYARQIGLDPRRIERSPASFYLELLSEQGLVGTAAFILFMAVVFRTLWRARHLFQLLKMEDEAFMTLAFLSSLAGYMVFYISKNSSYPNVFWLLLGIAFSIGQVAENKLRSSTSELNPLSRRSA